MPFIQTTQNSVQMRLRAMSHVASLLAVVGALLAILPQAVRALIVQLAHGDMDKECAHTTTALMRSDAVRVAFTMAYHEFIDLNSREGWRDVEQFSDRCAVNGLLHRLPAHFNALLPPLSLGLLLRGAGARKAVRQCRLVVLGGPKDAWWPQAHHSEAQRILGKGNTELQPEQQHAFCTSPRCCALATQVSERWIRRALGKHATCAASPVQSTGVTTRAMFAGVPLSFFSHPACLRGAQQSDIQETCRCT